MKINLVVGVAMIMGLAVMTACNTNVSRHSSKNKISSEEGIYKGLEEKEVLFESIPRNQGLTVDKKFIYVSPDHNTIEKRDIKDYSMVHSAHHPDLIGGLFYDAKRDEILTCSGEYVTDGKAFITRINKKDLSIIETIDISEFTDHGVNAIVRVGDRIYVGETAVRDNDKPKSWHLFDIDFKFIKTVYSHTTDAGRYDWQDATVVGGEIYATDHEGFVHLFKILPDENLSDEGFHDSSGAYMEGITYRKGQFIIWVKGLGIVTARLGE